MAQTTNDRVSALLKTLGIDAAEASKRIGKQPSTLYRIQNGESSPSKTTLQLIADGLGASYDWLLTGKGEMFSTAVKTPETRPAGSAEQLLIAELKADKTRLEKEVDRLFQIIGWLKPQEAQATGTGPGFNWSLQTPGSARVIQLHTNAPEFVRTAVGQ